jgi:hypothetical protein
MLQQLVNVQFKLPLTELQRTRFFFLLQVCSVLIRVIDVKLKALWAEISVNQPTNSRNKIQYNTNHETQFMTSIKLLHVSTRSDMSKCLGVWYWSWLVFCDLYAICVLFSEYVDWYVECRNVHCVSNKIIATFKVFLSTQNFLLSRFTLILRLPN